VAWWRSPAIWVLVVLAIIVWAPTFLKTENKLYNINVSWGGIIKDPNGKPALTMTADISAFVDEFAKDYRVVALAMHYVGDVDSADVTGLQKSTPRDIRRGSEKFLIYPDDKFWDEVKRGVVLTNYILMMIPKPINPSQFTTLREAEKLGARLVYAGGGPP
jgi:hypothetical protein